jgi:hypothetical protein
VNNRAKVVINSHFVTCLIVFELLLMNDGFVESQRTGDV